MWWARMTVAAFELSWRQPSPPHCLCWAKGDGWSELALQAHLLQLWERSVAPSLSSLISLSLVFSANTAPFLLCLPLSLTCLLHALCVLWTRCIWRKMFRQICFRCFLRCFGKISYATANVHIKRCNHFIIQGSCGSGDRAGHPLIKRSEAPLVCVS